MTTNNDKDRRVELFNEMLENSEAMVNQGQQMGVGFYPQNSDRSKILETLYDEVCASKKKNSFINKLTRKAIQKNHSCIASEMLDSEYVDAKELTDELYMKIYRRFIGLYFLDETGAPMNLR